MSVNVLVVINKDGRGLGPSETFLRAHIEGLPCKVFTLIGNPGYRQLDFGDEYLYLETLSLWGIVGY